MKNQEIQTLISSLTLSKTKIDKDTFLLMVKPYIKESEKVDALNLAFENKIIKGVRVNNDSKQMTDFRNRYNQFLEGLFKEGLVNQDRTNPSKPKFIVFDNNDDRRSLDINMSNLDARIRKVEKSGLEVSKETSEKISKP